MSRKTRRPTPWILVFALSCLGVAILITARLQKGSTDNETDGALFSSKRHPKSLADLEPSLIPNFPPKKPPAYRIEAFKYVAVEAGKKLWKIDSEKTLMYNPERLVHGKQVQAQIYNPDHQITWITGEESKYFLNQSNIELYGKVHITLPDGFEIWSEYVHYSPKQQHLHIPRDYEVTGKGKPDSEESSIAFKSKGLDYRMQEGFITLLDQSQVTLTKKATPSPSGSQNNDLEVTVIDADRAEIHRKTQVVQFKMNPQRLLKDQFVYIAQPTLLTRARKVSLHYGDFKNLVHYLVALDDVLIKELPDPHKKTALRYATAGWAEFNTRNDIVTLKRFPQLYEGGDTVVGDRILLHRNSDLVEIQNSNAFSEGVTRKKKE